MAFLGASCARETRNPFPDVLLITLDTTRADRLGCYGCAGGITPNLDRLASEGVLFTQAIAQAAVTPVSHASILTGLNPYSHGLRVMHGRSENRLPEECVTLAEVLREAGYRTGAFVSAFPVTEWFGLQQGFDHFDSDFLTDPEDRLVSEDGIVNTGKNQRSAGETTSRALSWLEQEDGPVFAWIHYFDPHDPYVLPSYQWLLPVRHFDGPERELLRAIYDIEIAVVDGEIGRVLSWLSASGRGDGAVVIVVADHGEGLGDHDWWTHGVLYDEQIQVPLVLRAPGVPAGRQVHDVVRTIDILPTVLELAGMGESNRPPVEGFSLVPLFGGRSAPVREAYSDGVSTMEYQFAGVVQEWKDDMLLSVTTDRWKYIHHVYRPEESELFDRHADPGEAHDVSAENSAVVAALRENLTRRGCFPDRQIREDEGTSPELLERLESLGYFDR